jgi:hypothetical protein
VNFISFILFSNNFVVINFIEKTHSGNAFAEDEELLYSLAYWGLDTDFAHPIKLITTKLFENKIKLIKFTDDYFEWLLDREDKDEETGEWGSLNLEDHDFRELRNIFKYPGNYFIILENSGLQSIKSFEEQHPESNFLKNIFKAFDNFSGNSVEKINDMYMWYVHNPGEFTLFWEKLSQNIIWVGHHIGFNNIGFNNSNPVLYVSENMEEKLDMENPDNDELDLINNIKYSIYFIKSDVDYILESLYEAIHILGEDDNLIHIINIIKNDFKKHFSSYTIKTHETPPMLKVTYNTNDYNDIILHSKMFMHLLTSASDEDEQEIYRNAFKGTTKLVLNNQQNIKIANDIIDNYTDITERYSEFIINEMYEIVNDSRIK